MIVSYRTIVRCDHCGKETVAPIGDDNALDRCAVADAVMTGEACPGGWTSLDGKHACSSECRKIVIDSAIFDAMQAEGERIKRRVVSK